MANLWGGQSQVGTQTNTNAPWTPQQPFLYDMFGRANDQVSAGGQPNRFQNSAINSMQGMQGQHNPYSGMNNPYLQGSINSASQDAMRNLQPMLNQANAQSGSFGNTGVAETYGRAAANTLGNISNNARMGAYNQDAQTWGQDQTRNMSGATDMYNMGTNYGNIPWNNINNYHNAITGTYGGTQSSPIMGGGTQDTLGTLSTVAGLWNAYNNYNKNSG